MEDDKNASLSDRDKEMTKRFDSLEDSDDDEESDEKEKKSEKKTPKKSLFLGVDESKTVETTEDQKNETKKQSLFSGLLRKNIEQSEPEQTVSETEQQISEEFQEVVVEKLESVENAIEQNKTEQGAAELLADADYLETVGARLEEGMAPETAVDDALLDIVDNPQVDPTEQELQALPEDVYVPVTQLPEVQVPLGTVDTDQDDVIHNTTSQQSVTPRGSVSPLTSPNVQNVQPNIISPTQDLEPMNDSYYRNRRTGDVLLGGVIGYLVGRKRGRNQGEAKMQPIINEKTERIENLTRKLEESEEVVRKNAAANETYSMHEVNEQKQSTDKIELSAVKVETILQEKKDILQQESEFERHLESEQKIQTTPEQKRVQQEYIERRKDPQTMTMSELLEVADHIMLDEFSVSELYRNHRIDAVNLRRVVIEYLQGTKHETMLRRALEAVEMHRELRNEIKKEDTPVHTFTNGDRSQDIAGLAQESPTSREITSRSSSDKNDTSTSRDNEFHEASLYVSNTTAIVLGVIAGIAITFILLNLFA